MKKLTILLIIVVAFLVAGFFWYQNGLAPVNKKDTAQKSFIIPRGAPLREIANDLKEQGLIKDPVAFFLFIKIDGVDQDIQAGNFMLSPSLSSKEIAEILTTGVLDVWVTIPEGKRADEVADILSESIPSYDESWRAELNANEGYLFPDTYLIPRDATLEQIITLMRGNFDTKYASLDSSNSNLTQEEVVIIASMIEREVRHQEDLRTVSSVIDNRLEIDMPLQIDATIQYAKGVSGNWWSPVKVSEYQSVKSDYNTYLNPGLPPGPIANPGINALQAALNPESTDYFYYITDKSGTNRYAKTLDEHNENIQRYGL